MKAVYTMYVADIRQKGKILVFAFALFWLLWGSPLFASEARNILLFLGDGLGLGEYMLAYYYADRLRGNSLKMTEMMEEGSFGLLDVSDLTSLVPDSASSATAMATGQKTLFGFVSLSADNKPLKTILEHARERGMATGLVTTTSVTHATPAVFACHNRDRHAENEAAEQCLNLGITVLLGGGIEHWIPKGGKVADFVLLDEEAGLKEKSSRKDGRNLIDEARAMGYTFVHDEEGLKRAPHEGKLLGLFSYSHLPWVLDRQKEDGLKVPSLPLMTQKALEILISEEKGFFLMVEGGRIDHAGHANDAASCLAETLEFDEAVGCGLDFAKRDGHTLLLVSSDHAGTGLSLSYRHEDVFSQGKQKTKTLVPTVENLRVLDRQDASFQAIHTEFKKKPTLKNIKKAIYDHTQVAITDHEARLIRKAEPLTPFHVTEPQYRSVAYALHAMGRALGEEHSIVWASGEHTHLPVFLMGYGPGSEEIKVFQSATAVFDIMAEAIALEVESQEEPIKFPEELYPLLDSPERKAIEPAEALLDVIEPFPGMVYADLGCGTGFFTIPVAKTLGPEGKAFAVDISAKMLQVLKEKLQEQNITNIQLIHSEENQIPLKDGLIDLATLCDTFHELMDRRLFLREVHRILKPGATFIIVDWKQKPSPIGPPVEKRVEPEVVKKLLKERGFENIQERPLYEYHYVIRCTKVKETENER